MSITQDECRIIVEFRIEKALRSYEHAKANASLGFWEVVANRLYYAAFDAVSALLVAYGDMPHTHSGVRGLFGMKFVREGLVDSDLSRIYNELFEKRQTGDYDDAYCLTERDVSPLVEPAGKLISVVVALARQKIAEMA